MREKRKINRLGPALRKALLRPAPFKEQRRAILIALEDERSSRHYFEEFRNELKAHRIVVIAEHSGSDPKSVVGAAKAARDERDRLVADGQADSFDEIWVVFDTEGPQNRDRIKAARHAIDQAKQLKFRTAVSNPCFEFWLLLHFEWNVQPFNDCAAVCRQLKTHIRNYTKGNDCYAVTRRRVDQAIKFAERIFAERHGGKSQNPCDCHPSTEIHRLVVSLLSNA